MAPLRGTSCQIKDDPPAVSLLKIEKPNGETKEMNAIRSSVLRDARFNETLIDKDDVGFVTWLNIHSGTVTSWFLFRGSYCGSPKFDDSEIPAAKGQTVSHATKIDCLLPKVDSESSFMHD